MGILGSPLDQGHKGPGWMRIVATNRKGKVNGTDKNSSSYATLLRDCFCGVDRRTQMERIKGKSIFMFSLFVLSMPAMVNVGICYGLAMD